MPGPADGQLVGGNIWMGGKLHPVFRGPFSDAVNASNSKQNGACGFFEYNFWKCMEAYGQPLGRRYCDLEWRDSLECSYAHKQFKRYAMMREERMKQFAKGELDVPFLQDHPKIDQTPREYYDYNPKYEN